MVPCRSPDLEHTSSHSQNHWRSKPQILFQRRCLRFKKMSTVRSLPLLCARDGVQQPVSVKKILLVTCWPVAQPGYFTWKHKICALSITLNVGPYVWFMYGFSLSIYETLILFVPYSGSDPSIELWLLCAAAGSASKDIKVRWAMLDIELLSTGSLQHENFFIPFLHITSSLEKALI